jgi:hypothetical protein
MPKQHACGLSKLVFLFKGDVKKACWLHPKSTLLLLFALLAAQREVRACLDD